MSATPPEEPERSEAPRAIARQLAFGFGLVSLVAVAMCGVLILQLIRVAGLVDSMRHDEDAIRGGAALSAAVREQYVHLAHTLIEGDRGHLDHYRDALGRVEASMETIESQVPAGELWRLDRIRENSGAIDERFRETLLTAMESGEIETLRREHRRVEELSLESSLHADHVARAIEGRMVGAHISATGVTRVGLLSDAICVALVVLLSIRYTLGLRKVVIKPLGRLTAAAQQIGSGDLTTRVGKIGRGELQAVASAFDRMVAELFAREKRVLRNERMAAIGQLAAGVAHEMNNPIGIIRGYLKTMQPEGDRWVLREELQILDDEASACQRIAEDLLTYARTPKLEFDRVRMHEFLERSTERLIESEELGEIDVLVRAESGTVTADRARLRQLVTNLLRNAAQASSEGGTVEIVGRSLGNRGYELRVCDSGAGVDEAERSKIFEPFYSKRSGGSGLGLAICQGIVAAHGGSIDVSTGSLGGAEFRVELPEDPPSRSARREMS
ncbi:MAG: hypothetical protein CME06_00015 [Gemmatimonadetes bacterium]|nr:hypothetical protein [Gemmatimonadota bacterium]